MHEPEPELAQRGPVREPSTPPSAQNQGAAEASRAVLDAWSPAVPAAHDSPGLDRSKRRNFWLWLAWRLRDASVVVADEVVPASEISSNSELVMIELDLDVVGSEAVHCIQTRVEHWRTVGVSTSLEGGHYIILQVDSAGRDLSKRVDEIASEVRGHAVHQHAQEIVRGQPFLLHSRSRRMLLWLGCFKTMRLPLSMFHEYFGAQVALYFEMVEDYIRALGPLSVAGVVLWLIEARERRRPNSSLISGARMAYRMLTNIWTLAVVYQVDRKRKASVYTTNSHQWEGVITCERLWQQRFYHSSATSMQQRRHIAVRVIRSVVVTAGMLGVSFLTLVSFLNLQGYMNARPSPNFVPPAYVRRLRISSIARYSEPGGLFDSRYTLRMMVPTMLHTCVIALLNKLYQHASEWLTAREGHVTDHDAQNHLIFKRVLFEAMDMYLPLVYVTASLGGGQRDQMIKSYMLSMYLSDELRRIATESFVPLLFKRRREAGHFGLDANKKASLEIARVFAQSPEATAARAAGASATRISTIGPKPTDALHNTSGGGVPTDEYEHARRRIIATSERAKPPYSSHEVFSDYLEMVLQFGYVALWSDHFPLAPLFSIVHNLIEVRSDAFKMCFIHRRGVPATQGSERILAQWLPVLKVVAVLSTAKNLWRLLSPAKW